MTATRTLIVFLTILIFALVAGGVWTWQSIPNWGWAIRTDTGEWTMAASDWAMLKYAWPLVLFGMLPLTITAVIGIAFASESLRVSDLKADIKKLSKKLELANESAISAKANAKMDLNTELVALHKDQQEAELMKEKAIQMRDEARKMAKDAKETKEYANERTDKAKSNVKKSKKKAQNASAAYARIKNKEKKRREAEEAEIAAEIAKAMNW